MKILSFVLGASLLTGAAFAFQSQESADGAAIRKQLPSYPVDKCLVSDEPLDDECLWDPAAGLGACGDWCGGPRIEGAFLSGMAMAGSLLRHLTIDRPAYRVEQKQQLTLI